MNRRRAASAGVRKVSDIPITRLFQVECPRHGVIDQTSGYSDAVKSRRDHYFDAHKEES